MYSPASTRPGVDCAVCGQPVVRARRLGELGKGDAVDGERPEVGVRIPLAYFLHAFAVQLFVGTVHVAESDGADEPLALRGVRWGNVAYLYNVVQKPSVIGV